MAFGIATVFLGSVMINYYDWGMSYPPENMFQKLVNLFLISFLGLGPSIYKRMEHLNWFYRRIVLFIIMLVFGLIGVIIYEFISQFLQHLLY